MKQSRSVKMKSFLVFAALILLAFLAVYVARFFMPQYRATPRQTSVGLSLLILSMVCNLWRRRVNQVGLRRGLTVLVWGLLAGGIAAEFLL
jgi:hypothetical protein